MTSRRWLLLVSIGIHLALVATFAITGMWRIERLDPGRLPGPSLAVMQPIEAAGGSAPRAAPKAKPTPKPPKTVVHAIVQPEKHFETPPPTPTPEVATTEVGDGSGSGSGSNTGSGSGTGSGGCTDPDACCPLPPCGGVTKTVAVIPPPPPTPELVAPQVIAGLRMSGDTQVHPTDVTKMEMMRDDRHRVVGTFKVCLDASGGVASVGLVASTHYAAYDDRLTAAMTGWRYRPYNIGGRAVPVCGMVTFVYVIE